MSKMTITLAIASFLGVVSIFITLLARSEPVGYSFTIFFVIFVSVVPVGCYAAHSSRRTYYCRASEANIARNVSAALLEFPPKLGHMHICAVPTVKLFLDMHH
jgi:hypothetical protein